MKKIGLDLDSVLAEIVGPLNKFHNKHYKTNYSFENYSDYRLYKIWKCLPEESMKRVYDFYNSPDFDYIEMVAGAKEAVDYLSGKYELVVITSRPNFTEKRTDQWVKRNFPGKISMIYHTNQFSSPKEKKKLKSEICIDLNIKTLVDDNLDFALDCALKDIKVFLMDNPWNQQKKLHKNIKRVKSWSEATKYL